MSSAMSKGILWGSTPGPREYSLTWDLGQRILYSKPQLLSCPSWNFENAHCLSHSSTPKAPRGHSEGHYTSPYWLCWCSVRRPMQLCRSVLYRTKESYMCVCVCCVLLFTCKFEPMTRALFEQVQRDRRVVFDSAKDTPSPESWKLPQTTPTDFAVFSEMSYGTFSFCTLQDIVYIFVLLFTCKFEPMTRAIFDQVQRDLRAVFEGPVWDATLIPAMFLGALKWPASWHFKPESIRSMWLQGSICREHIVNRIFSDVVRELWGPILPFLEMRKVLEHWGEACPALMYSGLMKSEARVKPITLVLQPIILHSFLQLLWLTSALKENNFS